MQHFEKNVTFMLIWWQEQIIERLAVQHLKPCCWNSLWFSVVLLKYAWPSLKKASSWWGKHVFLYNLSIPFSIHGAFPDVQAARSKAIMHLSVRDAGFRTEHWWLNKPDSPVLSSVEDTASMFSKNNVTFWWIWPQKSFYLGLSPFQTCSVPKKTADDVQLCPFPPYSLNVLMIIWVFKILCCVHYSEIVSDWRPTFLHVLACWRVSVSSK